MDRFHVAATGYSVNYFPEYLGRELGLFRDAGLNLTSNVPEPWEQVLVDLVEGRAEAVLGGVWVPAMYRGVREYRVFAQLTGRAPMSLLAREPVAEFDWSFLDDKAVMIAGGGHASPYLYLAGVLREAGYDPGRARFLHDLPDQMFHELFCGGTGDVWVTDDLTAAVAERAGTGHVVARLVEIGGPVPWSIYYTTPQRAAETTDVIDRFVAGLDRSYSWLTEHDVREAGDIVKQVWPALDAGLVLAVLERLADNGAWSGVAVDPAGLARWQSFLVAAGLISEVLDHDTLVDRGPAEAVMTR